MKQNNEFYPKAIRTKRGINDWAFIEFPGVCLSLLGSGRHDLTYKTAEWKSNKTL